MGRLQQLRAKALSLRGALAMGGVVVIAASMTQVAGTLAAPDELRTAKLGTSTQNYFPTPLVGSISCSTSGAVGFREANVSWTAPPAGDSPTGYRYRVSRYRSNGDFVTSSETSSLSTGKFRIGGTIRTEYLYVQTINPVDGSIVSSGSRSFEIYSGGALDTYCRGSARVAPNQDWENTYSFSQSMAPFAVGPTAQLFTTFMDTLNSEEALEPLPEETELADLETAARPEPSPTDDAKPTELESSTTAPSDEAVPDTETSSTASASSTSSSSSPSSAVRSTPATSTAGTIKPSTTATTPRALPTTPTTMVSATGTTTATTVWAGVGDSPIRVGEVFARLDEVDGQPRLVVTNNASGGEVCTVQVPGATRIQSSDGELTVTIEGRTRAVDPANCMID